MLPVLSGSCVNSTSGAYHLYFLFGSVNNVFFEEIVMRLRD